jgi:hypothetical protein
VSGWDRRPDECGVFVFHHQSRPTSFSSISSLRRSPAREHEDDTNFSYEHELYLRHNGLRFILRFPGPLFENLWTCSTGLLTDEISLDDTQSGPVVSYPSLATSFYKVQPYSTAPKNNGVRGTTSIYLEFTVLPLPAESSSL